ncbi:MAG: flagellar motor switch protein FliM [Clostridia bacterium]|nr:flagellar motor switch protein FliM [Clostridia bacterium]
MAEILSQSEIDALLNALQTGEIDAETIKQQENEKKIRVYDFRRPNKFSKEQLNTIEVISENYCRLITTYLSGQLRTRVQIKVASVEQLTYEEFIRSVPNPTILNIFGLEPFEGKGIFEISPHLAFYIIDRLFGGPGVSNIKNRPLTEIEQIIITKTVTKLLDFFKEAWSNLVELTPEYDSLDTNPSFTQIVSPTEMVVLITLDVQLGDTEGFANICLPCIMLGPISNKLNARFWYGTSAKEQTSEYLQYLKSKVKKTRVPITALLGRTTITLKELLDLQKGDVIALDTPINSEIDLVIGSKTKFKGQVGLSGSHLAVQIINAVPQEEGEDDE